MEAFIPSEISLKNINNETVITKKFDSKNTFSCWDIGQLNLIN